MVRIIVLCLLGLCASSVSAQKNVTEKKFNALSFWSIALGYGIEQPIGDLADRFGYNLDASGRIEYITKNNLIFGITAEQKFGNRVKEDIFEKLYSPKGRLLGANNRISEAYVRMRGNYIGLHVGKIFKFSKNRSGLRCTFGAGIMSHHIRIVDESNALPQIFDDYIAGYDRLTRGFALKQFVGYQHISEDKLINFTIGFDFMQGFTKPIRKYNFATTELQPKMKRFDGYIGLKASWILPFYQDYEADEIFY